ncbi:MAG: helix-turn-helix domain-containing protein [Chloroflexi bacterium]|nr:MAG: helix-turn-helix domain-containing protein [Chloroflexota bacterium]
MAREIDDVGLTIREFARRIGVDEAQLSRVIHGGPCDPEMAFLIVRHLERLEPVR